MLALTSVYVRFGFRATPYARYQSSDDELSRSISRGLDNCSNDHDHRPAEHSLFSSKPVPPNGGYHATCKASNIVKRDHSAQETRTRVPYRTQKTRLRYKTAQNTLLSLRKTALFFTGIGENT